MTLASSTHETKRVRMLHWCSTCRSTSPTTVMGTVSSPHRTSVSGHEIIQTSNTRRRCCEGKTSSPRFKSHESNYTTNQSNSPLTHDETRRNLCEASQVTSPCSNTTFHLSCINTNLQNQKYFEWSNVARVQPRKINLKIHQLSSANAVRRSSGEDETELLTFHKQVRQMT